MKSVRPDQEGRFLVSGLPAGSYLVAATDFMADGDWEDSARLQALRPDAMRVTLPAGTTESLTAAQAGLTKAQLSEMELAWSIGFPDATGMRAQGAVVANAG